MRPRARGRARTAIRRRSLRRDSSDVVQGVAVTLVRPLRALVAQRGMEADGMQRAFDVIGIVALFQQRERDTARAPAGLRQRSLGQLLLGPLGVRALQVARQATE